MTETPDARECARKAHTQMEDLRAKAAAASAERAADLSEQESKPTWTALFGMAPDLPYAEEPTFTASEVKELTTKATEVALALGRKEAQFECAAMLEDRASGMAGSGTARLLFGIAQGIRNFASRPQGATSEPLTAPTGHSDLPPTPEAGRNRMPASCDCYKLPRAADGFLRHHPKCPNATPDLPEGRDQ